ncbi:MAG: glycosyltransferase family 4 protein [Candidatus Omnitrophica bacterium]|nr:glycosyltransferase family 4 protein [Candidatus Omnitrophota bacterium]
MKVLFWVPYPHEGASNRYRIEQYLPYLEKEGISAALHPFWSSAAFKVLYEKGNYFKKVFFFLLGVASRFLDIFQLSGYDVVFVHREAFPLGSCFFESVVSFVRKPVIFDFDDAIFLPFTSPQNNFIEKYKKPQKIAKIVELSDYVIAGNDYLAEFALRHNRCVSVIPTPVDLDKYYPAAGDIREKVVVGWIGSVTTMDFLKPMTGVFAKLSERFPNIEFKIVGGDLDNGKIPGVICVPWSLEEELGQLRTFDIGIMPMPDNEWTRGKCGFKAILYMSMAIPSVCSPVGMNKEIIADGVNGFLASDEDQWLKKLTLLIEDSGLRKRMGIEAKKTVEERYSVKVNAPKFIAVLKEAYKKNRQGQI